MRYIKWNILFVFGLSLWLVQSSWAEGPSLSVGLRNGFFWPKDQSVDVIQSSDFMNQISFYGDLELFQGLILSRDRFRVGLNYSSHRSQDDLFESIEVSQHFQSVLLHGDYGYGLTESLTAYFRFDMGLGFYHLSFRSDWGEGDAVDASANWVWNSKAGIGLEYIVPYDFWSDSNVDNTVGIRTDFGRTLNAQPEFTLTPSTHTPEDEKTLKVQETSLGSLDLNAWYLSIDFFVRF